MTNICFQIHRNVNLSSIDRPATSYGSRQGILRTVPDLNRNAYYEEKN
jgi:hypothetical protein